MFIAADRLNELKTLTEALQVIVTKTASQVPSGQISDLVFAITVLLHFAIASAAGA